MKIQNEVAGHFFAFLAEILIDRHLFSPLAFLTHSGLRSLIRNSRLCIVLPSDYFMRFFKKEQAFEKAQSRNHGFLWIWAFILILFCAGCFYNLDLKRSVPLRVALKNHQPLALIPISDAKGFPSSGSKIFSAARNFLQKRGYLLADSAEVSQRLEAFSETPFSLFSNTDFARDFAAQVQAKLLLIGALAEYRLGKSYVGTKTEQVWEGGLFDYRMLPTYHWGHSRIRLIFKLVDSESGKIVWMAEGILQGPSSSAEALSKRLAEGLLEDLPSIPSGASSEAK